MKNNLLLVFAAVAVAVSISFVVYANDYETDKIPLSSTTTTTSTSEYNADKTTTAHSEHYSTTNKRQGGLCDIEHTAGDIVEENIIAPSCTKDGSYDLVQYCIVCEEEISREKKIVKALDHNYAVNSFVDGVADLQCVRNNCSNKKTISFADYYNTDVLNPNEFLDANHDGFINAKDFVILKKSNK